MAPCGIPVTQLQSFVISELNVQQFLTCFSKMGSGSTRSAIKRCHSCPVFPVQLHDFLFARVNEMRRTLLKSGLMLIVKRSPSKHQEGDTGMLRCRMYLYLCIYWDHVGLGP